jgi:CheY-like chemotaxis protein/anti-sigma regulatory factor (Ser/Thr protein kinase)
MEGLTTPFDDMLYKPVTIQEMARSVRRVIAQRPVPKPQETPATEAATLASGGPTVLLAEDSNVTRVLLRTWLVKGGYRVQECRDGLEAWEAFSRARGEGGFSLVLTDIVMPRMSGLELAAQIRAVDTSVPIVILSTSEDSESMMEAIHLQVNEFLTKPFESAVLLDCVKRLSLSHDKHLKGLRSVETAQAVRMAQRAMEAVPEKDMPIFSISEPLTDAGGDVFRCHRIADGSIFFAIADVAGHSVISSYAVAAYLGMLSNFVGECRHLRPSQDRETPEFQSYVPCGRFSTGPCQPLRHLALKLNRTIMTGPFSEVPICSLFGIWSPLTGRLHLLNAGIPHTRWYRHREDTTVALGINGAPLGILDDPPMEEKVIGMEPGDRLLLGSDGFFEAQSPEHVSFETILDTLWRNLACTDILSAINLISEAARVHAAGHFNDDLLVVGLEQPAFQANVPRFSLIIPPEAAQIDRACHDLARWLEETGALASGSRRFETLLAVREALSNAMLHAHPVGPEPLIALSSRMDTQGRLQVAVLDEGEGFDVASHQPPDTSTSERGRGIPLIKHFASEVTMTAGELQMTFNP